MKITLQQIQSIRFSLQNLQSSFVVFLVALPLCLGIALASGAPAASGLIAGIIGGLIVGFLSPSEVSVAGPTASLIVIVLVGIEGIGSFEKFCLITVWAGLFQLALGYLRFGTLGALIPSSVIKGMIAAIGILIILKQIPHAVGLDTGFFGDESFSQRDGENTFSAISHAFSSISSAAVVISAFTFMILLSWNKISQNISVFKFLPAALVAVCGSILLNESLLPHLGLHLSPEHLVQVPNGGQLFSPVSPMGLFDVLSWDNFVLALTVCLVVSIETIFILDASEKIDLLKRSVDPSRELYAQGAGNIVSGLLGGLPMAAVLVRTSANVTAGAKGRLSTILHGTWLLTFALLAPALLNMIPLASLAAILIYVGWKRTSPTLFRDFAKLGKAQFIPFVVTVVAILFSDLIVGVLIGFVVGLFFVFKANLHASVVLVNDGPNYLLRFNKDTSFLNKPHIKTLLASIPHNADLLIDGSRSVFIDLDIIHLVEDFVESAELKNIKVQLRKSTLAIAPYFKE